MAIQPTRWREPELFAAGDTLKFQRNLPNYLPSDGWAIRLTVTQATDTGGAEVAQEVSLPDVSNQFHCFEAPDFCGGLDAGTYILSEEVFNVGTGEEHQVYFNDNFRLGADLDAGKATVTQKTEAQEMIEILRASLKELYQRRFQETDVQRTRFVMQKQTEVLEQLKYWKAVRQNEIQLENVRNGRPSGTTQDAVFQIG